jgi:predicted nucleotidyltransferase
MDSLSLKPRMRPDTVEVQYSRERWALLRQFREKATSLMSALESRHIQAIVHGSIARGDVDKDSDIDMFILNAPSSFQVETALEQANIPVSTRLVIQATPAYAMKAYIELDSATTVSFPLMPMRRVEREFYQFGGELTLAQLKQNIRVSGVDKRLMLVEPTEEGHVESSIVGREEQTAQMLSVAVETVRDRVRALRRRDAVGRTGVFIKKELVPEETFEMALKRLAKENPAVRRKLKTVS